jgi:hypothetical protein
MRRFSGLLLSLVLVSLLTTVPVVLGGGAPVIVDQLFVTSTPRPTVAFVTNTPLGPTDTSTPSPTPSATATATDTATPTATDTPTSTPTFTPSPTPNGPFLYPDNVNSLTGLEYPSDEARDRRNLIVKISNYPPVVRPQSGVNAADVVYEVEAEGGVTRFAAIFRTNAPERVGSVRSARLIDMELVAMYDALLAYSGTSEPIQQLILASDWVFQAFSPLKGDNENAGFERDPRRPGIDLEHTMFLNTQTLYDLATERNVNTGYKARGFAFSEDPDPDAIEAEDIFVDWYGQTDARWQYDEETGRYLRYTDGVPHYDAATGEQIYADNLVIIEVEHNRRPDLFPEGATYESLEIALWDQGRTYVARDGGYYQGWWRRASQNPRDALQLIYGDNTPIMLKPGRTWVSVVRGLGNVQFREEAADMEATGTVIAQTATRTPIPITEAP